MMMSVLNTIWLIFKILFAVGALVFLFFTLHPFAFDFKIRVTPKGGRGRLRFSHLFGLFRIDAVGNFNSQELVVGFWRWSKRISSNAPKKYSGGARLEEPAAPPAAESGASSESSNYYKEPKTEAEPETHISDSFVASEKDEKHVQSSPQPKDAESPNSETQTDFIVSDIPQRQEPSEASASKERPEQSYLADRLRKQIKSFLKRASDVRRKIKRYARLVRKTWKRASPMFLRFFSDIKRSVEFKKTMLRIRYGLSEPHLTGMLHGIAAPTAGVASLYNIAFEPIPIFDRSTFYMKFDGGIRISPWRVLWASLVLLSTREFWSLVLLLWRRRSVIKASIA